jgi:hypothetical protein
VRCGRSVADPPDDPVVLEAAGEVAELLVEFVEDPESMRRASTRSAPQPLTPPAPPSAGIRVAHPPARTVSSGTGAESDSRDER